MYTYKKTAHAKHNGVNQKLTAIITTVSLPNFLRNGDEHPTYTSHGEWHTFTLQLDCISDLSSTQLFKTVYSVANMSLEAI